MNLLLAFLSLSWNFELSHSYPTIAQSPTSAFVAEPLATGHGFNSTLRNATIGNGTHIFSQPTVLPSHRSVPTKQISTSSAISLRLELESASIPSVLSAILSTPSSGTSINSSFPNSTITQHSTPAKSSILSPLETDATSEPVPSTSSSFYHFPNDTAVAKEVPWKTGIPVTKTTANLTLYTNSSSTAHKSLISGKPQIVAHNASWAYAQKNISQSALQTAPVPYDESLVDASNSRIAAVQKPKIVFAHFMVGNVAHWNLERWSSDIEYAKFAHIDAFALNMANGEEANLNSLDLAFQAASSVGFKLVFSFDYAGNGKWLKEDVITYVNRYKTSSAYYHYNGKPFVSTFEGPQSAEDWHDIKAQTNCFFIPDWSSLGAKDAIGLAGGVADGLFSWAAWPWGNTDMNTYVDASYLDFLGGKPYMMPVSPWFFTNLPGFDKNWLWRGDDLWFDRWEQVQMVQPEFVQIISWNDFGESHYIGPLDQGGYGAFQRGSAPYNYVETLSHDGWRQHLPYVIDTYKNGFAYIRTEGVSLWYRLHPAAACSSGGTTGNTASQLLLEFSPAAVSQDMVFYSAELIQEAEIRISVGGVNLPATFQDKPSGGIGIYHGHVATNGLTGPVVVTILRSGVGLMTQTGDAITTNCALGIQNWNAFVMPPLQIRSVTPTRPVRSIEEQECVSGTGAGIFAEICGFTCAFGYCPIGACQCIALGKPAVKPPYTGVIGYPAQGMSASFEGLCSFACNLGKCPSNVCGTVKYPPVVWTSSPFLPPACNQGTGQGPFAGLCSFACDFGFCPMAVCTCTRTGVLNQTPPPTEDTHEFFLDGADDHGLCKFACSHGWCPNDVCQNYVEETPEDWDPSPVCDATFDSLDALDLARDSIHELCMSGYIVQVEAKLLGQALSDYETILDDGYDDKFEFYAEYVQELVAPRLRLFMQGDARKYFSCTKLQEDTCCNTCGLSQGCWLNCIADPCTPKGQQQNVACPTRIPQSEATNGRGEVITYTLIDRAGFFAELSSKHGIEESAIVFRTTRAYIYQNCWMNPNPTEDCYVYWNGYPAADHFTVENPKDLISESFLALKDFQSGLGAAGQVEGATIFANSVSDIAEAAAFPSFMVLQAVESLRAVVKLADKLNHDQLIATIINFVTSALMFIPFIGAAASRISQSLGRIIVLSGVSGEIAVSIYSIYEDPLNAIFAIFGAVVGARDFSKAIGFRRNLSNEKINTLGPIISTPIAKIDNLRGKTVCRL